MPIRSRQNLYPGINPHLNSALQADSWRGFHTLHLGDLARLLDDVLPVNYFTSVERSLQVTPTSDEPTQETRSDILVYRNRTTQTPSGSQATTQTPVLELPLVDSIPDEDELDGLMIYKDNGGDTKTPVTRIELLSPSNMPGGSHNGQYLNKREATLKSGLRLVEIDYLHTYRPIDPRLPRYPNDVKAYPYYVLVSDPRPTYAQGRTYYYGFGLLDVLPIIAIPLADADTVQVDFGAAYQQTYSGVREFWAQMTDYEHEPANMNAYSAADQAKIRRHMAQIAAEQTE